MATGYSSTWSKYKSGTGTAYIRLQYTSVYNAPDNTSTVTLKLQFKTDGNYSTNYRFYDATGGDGGIWGAGAKLYTLNTGYGSGHYLSCGSADNTWKTMSANSGSISTFTVNHDENGEASFKIAAYGSVRYTNKNDTITPVGSTSGTTINLHEDAPYTISYNANGGEGAPASQSVYAGVAYNLSATQPTRSDCNFLGWATSASASAAEYAPEDEVTPSGNLTLYAVWSFDVTYDANGGSGAPATQTKTYGTTLTLSESEPTKTHFDFLGWATTADAVAPEYQPGGSYVTNAPVTLYAVWEVLTYTLDATVSPIGIVANAQRTSSPSGCGALGILHNGDTVYDGDTIKVSWSVSGGYMVKTMTVNGVDVSAYSEYTVTDIADDLVVVLLVESGGVVYIDGVAYQVFIDNGVDINTQYQAFIDNGAAWVAY